MNVILHACEICDVNFKMGDMLVAMDHVEQVEGTGGSNWVVVDVFEFNGMHAGEANLVAHASCIMEHGKHVGDVPINRG